MRNFWLSPPQQAHCCMGASAAVEMPATSRHLPLPFEIICAQEAGIAGAGVLGGLGVLGVLGGSGSAAGGAGALGGGVTEAVLCAVVRLAPRSFESVPAFLYGLFAASW